MKKECNTQGTSLVELLILISMRESEPTKADTAFNELHKRLESRIKRVCRNMYYGYTGRNNKTDVADLNQAVLERIFLKAEKFRIEECESLSELEKEIKFLNWISGIARTELLQQFEKQTEKPDEPIEGEEGEIQERMEIKENDIPLILDGMVENISDAMSGTVKKDSLEEKLVDRIHGLINALPIREADIIRTHLYYSPNNIPSKELERLVKTYGITKENIRQIKKRVLKKLDSKMKL